VRKEEGGKRVTATKGKNIVFMKFVMLKFGNSSPRMIACIALLYNNRTQQGLRIMGGWITLLYVKLLEECLEFHGLLY
jgi:hypothetical protein